MIRESLASAAVLCLLVLLLVVAWRYVIGTMGWGTAMVWLLATGAGAFGCMLWGVR